jgi:hypothetical protein
MVTTLFPMNRKHRADALFRPRGAFLFLIGILFWVGCDSPQQQATHNRSCSDLEAKIGGIDVEIKLHYDEVYDVRWRAQAFGLLGASLFDNAERHKNEIIKLRGQRGELYRLGQSEKCIRFVGDDRWDNYTKLLDRVKAVRDSSQPHGYSVVDMPSQQEMLDILNGDKQAAQAPPKRTFTVTRVSDAPRSSAPCITLQEVDAEVARRKAMMPKQDK